MSKRRISIMIVDDNDMMRSILRGMLRGDEYEVVGEARNGVIAVEMADRLKPDIICLDVMMPEKNGIDALVEIKAARPETIVVMPMPIPFSNPSATAQADSSSSPSTPPASLIPWRKSASASAERH